MSSTLVSVAPSAAASSPLATPTGSSISHNPLLNTSTLLLGFLVTALSLFGIFMTFAIIWNRLITRRRVIEAMMALSASRSATQTLRRPRMWDVWVISDKKPLHWLDVKPLAAANCDRLTSHPRTARAEQTIPSWKRLLFAHIPLEIVYLFQPPVPSPVAPPNHTHISPAELTNGSDIQVSLLISMPRAPSTWEREDENGQPLHELVIGTTSVVYHDS